MLELDLSTFPELTTERLHLRELRMDDAPALFALRTDERVMRFISRTRPASITDVEQLIGTIQADRAANAGISWALTFAGNDGLIGTIGFYRLQLAHYRAEVGYLLHPDHWGQGLMGEALEAVMGVAFARFRFHSIEARTDPENGASNRLLERQGFLQEGLLRESYFHQGRFQDTAIWSRLAPMR